MKDATRLVVSLAAVGSVMVPAGERVTSTPGPSPESPTVRPDGRWTDSLDIVVHGMACPACGLALERRLTALAAVDSVVADVGSGLVRIRERSGARLAEQVLHSTITDAGFTVERNRRHQA